MIEHTVAYGQKIIYFLLEQKPRKSFKISVMPDLSVEVSAPQNLSIEKIMYKVHKRGFWIIKQINYFRSFIIKEGRPQESPLQVGRPCRGRSCTYPFNENGQQQELPPRQFISGETHYYCGRQYRLKVIYAKKQDVKLKGKYIFIYSFRPDERSRTKRLVHEWYRSRAEQMFDVITKRCHKHLEKYGIKLPGIDVKVMKLRWGSCIHTKGRIGLNPELIKAPSHCIEYVIVHEMCHLKYSNHTKHFYNFLFLVMPDWKKRKARLEQVVL
ncbi:M48 family metallopeptidase [Candidatus Poribacteria bacterium]|nr:M48 family metallopeptidase [Candidatus Poribacteria bacterium]